MCSRMLFPFILLAILALPAAAQDDACGLTTRLSLGQIGRVLPGPANNVRAGSGQDAVQIGRLPGGHYFTALEGSACSGGFTWREIEFGAGDELHHGWTVEADATDYFLEPLSLEGIPVSYQGVSFVIPAGLADGAEGSVVEADVNADTGTMHIPAYVALALTGDYPDTDFRVYDAPQIEIYRTDAFAAVEHGPDDFPGMFEGAFVGVVEDLSALLEQRPDLTPYTTSSSRLPDLAPNVAHGALAHLDYFDFQSGSGYRFITFYEQNTWYPENNLLLYRYDGITADGRYLVSVTFPVDAPVLPEPFDLEAAAGEADYGAAAYRAYVDAANAFLSAIPADEWAPNLDWLDAVIASLVVDDIPALEAE